MRVSGYGAGSRSPWDGFLIQGLGRGPWTLGLGCGVNVQGRFAFSPRAEGGVEDSLSDSSVNTRA